METNFTQEDWLDEGDGFIYALRKMPGLNSVVNENIFEFKFFEYPLVTRPGEAEANIALILNAKHLFAALSNLIAKMEDSGERQGWRDEGETYRGFISSEFDEARAALEMAANWTAEESPFKH